jgi:tetratricopeptide (TPR) repeat protein
MGGFLVRYFKTRINFLLIYFIGFVPRVVKFQSPAWFMLPLWFLTQIFWALLLGNSGGVAFWAHIGGFAFGVGGALLLQVTGLEKRMDAAIEKEVTWQADPRVVRAGELMEKHQLDEAMAELRAALAEKPGLLDAHNLLIQATWRKQDMPAHREAIAAHIHALVKAKDLDTAWQDYQDFLNAGGESIAACDWIVLCRYAESKEDWERAASEYEKYAAAWPQEKMAVYALVSAARLRLKKLDQREEAARLYRAAESSPVPHIEWQDAIKRGLYEATSAS